jgi:hypothetical protein
MDFTFPHCIIHVFYFAYMRGSIFRASEALCSQLMPDERQCTIGTVCTRWRRLCIMGRVWRARMAWQGAVGARRRTPVVPR